MGNLLFGFEIIATVLCLAYLAKLLFGRAFLLAHLSSHPMYIAGAPFELNNSGKRCLKGQHISRRWLAV
ncbi:MAG: hypothetical protein KDD62_03175 [Bdellovibrionales bacterium]|nr:hypothetical protein [Bdellovibrionales bacterium]